MNAPSSMMVVVFVFAVVVARDGSGADVDFGSDRRIPEIRRWLAFEWGPSVVFFSSTKLPIFAPSPTTSLRAKVRERTDRRPGLDAANPS